MSGKKVNKCSNNIKYHRFRYEQLKTPDYYSGYFFTVRLTKLKSDFVYTQEKWSWKGYTLLQTST